MRKRLVFLTYLNLLLIEANGVQLDLQGPIFLQEPPLKLEFDNTAGGRIDCQAHGLPTPKLGWMLSDGTNAVQVPNSRIILSNGSLLFPPFSAENFRHDIHTAIYRCVAKNQVGTIISRDVIVKAVLGQKYEVQVYDEYVISGNTAILRCQVPNYLSEYILVTSWIQDGIIHIYPTSDTGGKYAVLKTGELCVFNAGPADGYKSYACRTVNKLTGETHSSTYPARIIITEVKEIVHPRAVVDRHSIKYVKIGEDILLPCIAHGNPVPSYRWFKEDKEQMVPINFSDRVAEVAQGLLHITKIKLEDQGKYLCWVNNSAGEETIRVNLIVTATLSAHVQPQSQIVDVDNEAEFTCTYGGFPVGRVSWFHNGREVFKDGRHIFMSSPERLRIKSVEKDDHGMYQCFISNEWDMAQSSAELQLGDASPELLSWFPERTLQPGPPISLKCSATGNPPPHFTWALDGFPLPDNSRFMVGQYITINDDVISHVNISNLKEEDGGEYSCTAKNTISQATYRARINVYGRPFIRDMPKVNAIAGGTLIIKCPVAGYPIEAITWEQAGVLLPINRRQRVYGNGTLVIEQVQKHTDSGTYTCQARNKQKMSDRRDVEVHVLVPPKILPIQSLNNVLREGMRAAITCQTIDGDLPFKFRWEKNGEPVTGTGSQIRRLDEYTSSIVIDNITTKHSGNYTCYAENVAGVESFTVPLTVNVPPRWQIEPTDANVAAGQDVMLNCQATGYPTPTVVWKKSIGEPLGEYKDFIFEHNVNFYPNGSLKFMKISKENEGHYLCEGKNEVGSGVSKLIFLKVNVPAHFPKKFKQLQVIQGEEAHLQCTALGDIPIEIIWKMNGQKIVDDPRFVIRDQQLDEGLVSELGISHTYRHDTGVLTCSASNSYGQDEMKLQLIVQEVPESPQNIRINDQKSRSIQVGWTQPYAGNSPITSYIVQYKLIGNEWGKHPEKVVVSGTMTTAFIQGLYPANSYHVRVLAENRIGKSEPSEVLQVTTQEEAPSGPPKEVYAEAKSSTQVIVTWKEPSPDAWNGKLLGYYIGFKEYSGDLTSNSPSSTSSTNSYNFQTVDAGPESGGEILLKELDKFTTYSVIVQAYNSRGSGPASSPTIVRTKEDVPSVPPENVRCRTMSSQSLEVQWEPPNPAGQNGILLGYKTFYRPSDDWFGEEKFKSEAKVTTSTSATLSGLQEFTNYSVAVLAFTSAGDGVKSEEIFCRTDEDVPSPPRDIKAAMSSPTKILVSWLPPRNPNGYLICYTFYMSIIENGKEEGTHKRILGPENEFHETVRLQERATYQFWLTASTRIGEGESSRIVTISPSNKVPAKIMSFSKNLVTPWKETLNLTCRKVGIPTPKTTWVFQDKIVESTEHRQLLKDGSLIIKDVQKSDQGNYTCRIENNYGRDEISYNLTVEVPPDRPTLSIISTTSDSIQLEWQVSESTENLILGYIINYKRDHGDWEELQIGPQTKSYVLQNLWCATRYQLYITAFNKIGTGLPCDIVNAFTQGTVPVKAKANQVISPNSTSVSVWVDSWLDGGCPIIYFIVEYQTTGQQSWTLASNSVQPSDRVYVVNDLKPATKYNLRVTAHNNAGSTIAVYNFTTLTLAGGTISPYEENESRLSEDVPFYYNLKVIILVFVSSSLLTTVLITAAFIRRKRMLMRHLATLSESPSVAQIQNEQNRDQQYLAIQVRNRSSKEEPEDVKTNSEEYIGDICPYATFQISKTPYAESTYGGNIYSGPYSSVKGSFVYHDGNTDALKLKQYKDHDYTKIRRKSGKLRDFLSENQESDNLGSTDSEVKKILSMHLPISEAETFGSDSDGENRMRTKGQELLSFRHRSRSEMENNDLGSSSSSERSQSGRKPFYTRKTKPKSQNSLKRHMRSSSGYSSHTEETTFSFSSRPSVKLSDMHSHSHDLDVLDCEKSRGKRRAKLNSSARYPAETSFQIDV